MPAKKKKKKAAEGSQPAIPSSFDSAKKKAKSAAQDKHNEQKRQMQRCKYAIRSAPRHVQDKWNEILETNSHKSKRDFVDKWVGSPDWKNAYFTQNLEVSREGEMEDSVQWVSQGRLEKLIGEKEAAEAIKDQWYKKRKIRTISGSTREEYAYTEEKEKQSRKMKVNKHYKGSAKHALEDGKEMFKNALAPDFSMFALGDGGESFQDFEVTVDEEPEEKEEEPASSGVIARRRPAAALAVDDGMLDDTSADVKKRPAMKKLARKVQNTL
jgi:hypothetical protein